MEFHKVFQIHHTVLDLAQLIDHQNIVEFLSHTNQN